MKKMIRRLISVSVSVVLLISGIMISSMAEVTEKSVSSVIDFSSLSGSDNVTKDSATIIKAGAVDCENVRLGGYEGTLASPPGYAGEGYLTQKLDAGNGKTLKDVKVELDYWMTSSSSPYVSVKFSNDNMNWTEVFKDTQAQAGSIKNASFNVDQATGEETAYIRISMVNWGGYDGASLKKSKITGVAVGESTEDGKIVKNVSSKFDFSSMAREENAATAVQDMKDYGLYDAENVFLGGNYGIVATPGGYMGEGYVVQKLDTNGKKVVSAKATVKYWAYHTTTDGTGTVKFYSSTDGETYTLLDSVEGSGSLNTVQTFAADIPVDDDTTEIFVKVAMIHWGSYEEAAVESITIDAKVEEEASDVQATKKITSKFDFTSMAREENTKLAVQDMKDYGLTDAENVFLGGNYGIVATPGGYMGEGYVVQKLSAPEGVKLLSADVKVKYWAYHTATTQEGYVAIYASADGVNYSLIDSLKGSSELSNAQTFRADLPVAEGSSEVYVKVCMQHWGTYEEAAIEYIEITGVIPDDAAEEKTDDWADNSALTYVVNTHKFNALAFGPVSAAEIGAEESDSMFFGSDGMAVLSPDGGYKHAYAVWKLSAADGERLKDAFFTFTGRTFYQDANMKDANNLKIYVSTDGNDYELVKDYRANDNDSFNQVFELDLSQYVYGEKQMYVKMDWELFDSPHIFGITSVKLEGNRSGTKNTIANDQDTLPGTGDLSQPLAALILAVSSVAFLAVLKLRRIERA